MKKGTLKILGGLVLLCLLMAGCQSRDSLVDKFSDAPLAAKQRLQEAVRLDQADRYLSAAEAYDAVLRMPLTPKQEECVRTAIGELFDRMSNAAARGDADAKKTMASIEASRRVMRE